MPTYQYHCKKCGESFERTEPILLLQCCRAAALALAAFPLAEAAPAQSLARREATGWDADARPTNVSVTKSNPLEAYIAVGGTIKRCWFNAADPLLPKHVYRADVSPGGGTVKITVHQRAKLGRAATSSPQYLLPKDLSRGIRQLTDQEFDRLLAAVLTEQKRRREKAFRIT